MIHRHWKFSAFVLPGALIISIDCRHTHTPVGLSYSVCHVRGRRWPSKQHGRLLFVTVLLLSFHTVLTDRQLVVIAGVLWALDRLPSICPVVTRCQNLFFVTMCPVNRSCFVLIVLITFILQLVVLGTFRRFILSLNIAVDIWKCREQKRIQRGWVVKGGTKGRREGREGRRERRRKVGREEGGR